MEHPEWQPVGELPDGCVPVGAVLAFAYIDAEGNQKTQVSVRGEAVMTTYLGLLDIAHDTILGWRHQPPDDDDDGQ